MSFDPKKNTEYHESLLEPDAVIIHGRKPKPRENSIFGVWKDIEKYLASMTPDQREEYFKEIREEKKNYYE